MASVKIKVIFPAILKIDHFVSQTVNLGGVFPEIEIELVDGASGHHDFKILRVLPDYGEGVVASVIRECQLQIDHFWNVLAYVRNTTICPTGQVYYEIDGRQPQEFNPAKKRSVATLQGIAGMGWFSDNALRFSKQYDFELMKRLNYCRLISEPIGRFLSFYVLLCSQCHDKQADVDKLIRQVDSNVALFVSPKDGKPETIFTKLRNELAHNRAGVSIIETRQEIELHLTRFEWIVQTILARSIEAA